MIEAHDFETVDEMFEFFLLGGKAQTWKVSFLEVIVRNRIN